VGSGNSSERSNEIPVWSQDPPEGLNAIFVFAGTTFESTHGLPERSGNLAEGSHGSLDRSGTPFGPTSEN